ncbi:MAG: cytochrome c peroxidase [Pseudomonadota bacterium]
MLTPNRRAVSFLTALALFGAICSAWAHKNHAEKTQDAVILAPGYQALTFEAPVPGSYELPIIKPAADGSVITHLEESTSLHRLLGDRIGIISFIYTNCDDVNGCPLASFVLSKIDKRIRKNPELANTVQLLSISFDFDTDSTDTLAEYANNFTDENSDWRFLKASSKGELSNLLKAYDQSIVVEKDGATISHILRVFLVDSAKKVRNVYSVSFLHADTVVNDILTLAANDPGLISTETARQEAADSQFEDYPTVSQALDYSTDSELDLHTFTQQIQLGLPAPATATAASIQLGRQLFFDRRLSHNNTISCAMCHIPEQGFTSNELSTAVGIEGRTVRRNSPTILNVGFFERLFHDGRENSLENQVWSPLLAENEMANPSIGFLLNKISRLDNYKTLFANAFPDEGLSMRSLGIALAAYERSLYAADSPVDRLLYAKAEASNPNERLQKGLELFVGKARCASCHTIGETSALFSDQALHNTGIGYARSMGQSELFRKVLVAPGKKVEVHKDDIGPSELDAANDLGLYEITENPADRWRYRTPSLRNVALTAPYMHNGSLKSLAEVISFYNAGGIPNPELDPLIQPLNLTDEEQDTLVYFLESLTSPHVRTLVENARATPIGDRE